MGNKGPNLVFSDPIKIRAKIPLWTKGHVATYRALKGRWERLELVFLCLFTNFSVLQWPPPTSDGSNHNMQRKLIRELLTRPVELLSVKGKLIPGVEGVFHEGYFHISCTLFTFLGLRDSFRALACLRSFLSQHITGKIYQREAQNNEGKCNLYLF